MMSLYGLQKVVDRVTVINIPQLQIAEEQIVAIVGSADSGLHTLFQLLTGQTPPTTGLIDVAGQTPDAETFGRSVGVLFEQDTLYPHMTVEANLHFVARLYQLDTYLVNKILSVVGLNDQRHVQAKKLPSGLMRRLAIGRTLLHDPQVLILFDPFARCDESTIALIKNVLIQQRDEGKTILILSPSTDHLHFCDQRFMLQRGDVSLMPEPETRIIQRPFRIPVRMDGKVALVNPLDVLYVTAQDGQVILCTGDDRIASQYSLTELEDRLSQSGFFRAHRAYLVNLQHVKDIISFTRDSFSLRLDDESETQIPLSKNAASHLKKLFGY